MPNEESGGQHDVLALAGTSLSLPAPRYPLGSVYEESGRRLRHPLLSEDFTEEFEAVMQKVAWSVSEKTAADYRGIIRNFWHFCIVNGLNRLDDHSVMDYLYILSYPRILYLQSLSAGGPPAPRGQQAGLGRNSIKVMLAAIGKTFEVSGRAMPTDNPAWRSWYRGLIRRLRQDKDRKDPIVRQDLERAVRLAREHANALIGLRDAALLLLGWSCALRRSELVAVHHEHLRRNPLGWYLWVPRSKTDQDGKGMAKPLYPADDPELDPLLACRRWAEACKNQCGSLFRPVDKHGNIGSSPMTSRSIASLLKSYCLQSNVSGHSLRVGYVTQAALDGKDTYATRLVTGHASDAMLNEYRRTIDVQRQGPGSLL